MTGVYHCVSASASDSPARAQVAEVLGGLLHSGQDALSFTAVAAGCPHIRALCTTTVGPCVMTPGFTDHWGMLSRLWMLLEVVLTGAPSPKCHVNSRGAVSLVTATKVMSVSVANMVPFV